MHPAFYLQKILLSENNVPNQFVCLLSLLKRIRQLFFNGSSLTLLINHPEKKIPPALAPRAPARIFTATARCILCSHLRNQP
jgi:hypothetical protein